MFPILAGLGLIILGLVGAFFGYRIFRALLPIYGGVAGFLLAWGWWGQSAWLLALVVGVVLAVVFAVLAYSFWSAMVAFAGVIMGGALGIAIGTSLNLWGWLTAIIAFGLAIVFGALFYWVRNEMVIISTAVSGATLTARGVGELFGWRSGLDGVFDNRPWLAILLGAVALVVFIAGLLYQWRAYAKLRWYDGKVPAAPALDKSAPSVQAAATRSAAQINAAAGVMGSTVTGSGAAMAGVATAAAVATRSTVTDAAATVSGAAGEVKADVSGAVADAGAAVAGVAGDVKAGAEGAVDATGDAVADAGAAVAGVAGDVTEGVSDAVADAGEAVADVAGDVEGGVEGAVDAAGEKLAAAGDATADFASEARAGGVGGLAGAGAAVAGLADDAQAEASEAVDAAGEKLAAAGDAAADVAGDVKAGAVDAVEAFGAVAVDAQDAVADAGETLSNKVEGLVESAAKALDIDVDENKVAKVLADLEKQFEGLEESAKFKEALEFVEGIGPAFAEKLKGAGINNVLDLLRQGATRKGRLDLAEKSGITGKLILEWVNHADLYRIKGVGSEFADLLEAAGVDTVPELAQRNPARLIEKMLATNEEKRLVRRAPHPSDVEDWVSQAKKMPRIIQY